MQVDIEVCVTVAVPLPPCTVEVETEVTVLKAASGVTEIVETLVTVACPTAALLTVTVEPL